MPNNIPPKLLIPPFWQRLAAGIYDLLPLMALWFFTAVFSLFFTAGTMDVRHPPVLYRLLLFMVSATYFVLSWRYGGQTLGMKAWGLRVVRNNGSSLLIRHALLRFIATIFAWLPLGLGIFWVLFNTEGRSWPDVLSGTRVEKKQREQ